MKAMTCRLRNDKSIRQALLSYSSIHSLYTFTTLIYTQLDFSFEEISRNLAILPTSDVKWQRMGTLEYLTLMYAGYCMDIYKFNNTELFMSDRIGMAELSWDMKDINHPFTAWCSHNARCEQ